MDVGLPSHQPDAPPPPASSKPHRHRPAAERSPWSWGNTPAGAVIFAIAALGLFLVSRRPLWHTDLWGHLSYGRLIWEQGAIPETAPLMPLARGVEFIDTAWLTQVLGYLTIRAFGVTALQAAAAACLALTVGVLMAIGWKKTGSLAWALIGGGLWLWLEWKQLFAGADTSLLIRPQIIGMLAFVITLAIVVGRPRRWHWVLIPAMFALWANLHGSFIVGLALFGMFALGRGIDLVRRTDRFGAIILDWTFWRYLLLGEIAAAAALLNPYGLRLYAEVWLFSENPNLASLIEWQPLTLRMFQGQAAAAATLVLIFLYRMTPRRIAMAEVIALLVFGGMTLWTSRLIVWWAPLAAWCVMNHGAAVWRSRARSITQKTQPTDQTRSSKAPWWNRPNPLWSLAGLAAVALALCASPFGAEQFRGQTIPFNQAVSSRTPLGAARHLQRIQSSNAPDSKLGLVFNAMEYGDFLLWTNPGIDVFAGSHVHLIPPDVWQAYGDIISGQAGWSNRLDRYGVQTIVLDRARRQSFINELSENENWRQTYQDRISAVFRRKPGSRSLAGETD